ncbi:dTDP-4-dehydrorhamnose reductase [Neisseria sp. Ec49-e6-T10]|uniref:dTDP-4-dehydrorhamnose reductase n=1 Tax=Neisseria sp. Ec49-e6-T10 TaxID=3140744 RepID=UPI003EC013F3
MKIMICGCNGQIGQSLLKQTGIINHQVLALNHSQLDITDKNAAKGIIETFSPDIIINAAAYTNVNKAQIEQDLAFKVNRDGAINLAQLATQYNAILIHISSDYVFSGQSLKPYTEEDIPYPCNVYGASKLAGEIGIAQYCPKHIILRTSWVFGEYGHNFFKTILNLAQTKTQLDIVGDQFGGPTSSDDIASTIFKIANQIYNQPINSSLWGIYHYCGLPYANWAEITQNIIELAYGKMIIHKKPIINQIQSFEYDTLAKRPANSSLICSKVFEEFQIAPCNWKKALAKIFDK